MNSNSPLLSLFVSRFSSFAFATVARIVTPSSNFPPRSFTLPFRLPMRPLVCAPAGASRRKVRTGAQRKTYPNRDFIKVLEVDGLNALVARRRLLREIQPLWLLSTLPMRPMPGDYIKIAIKFRSPGQTIVRWPSFLHAPHNHYTRNARPGIAPEHTNPPGDSFEGIGRSDQIGQPDQIRARFT